jgi:hypothetical protein
VRAGRSVYFSPLFGELLACQPSLAEPIEYGLRRDADDRGGALHGVASIRPSRWVRRSAVDFDGRDLPPPPQEVDHLAGERRPMRRAKPFRVEDGSDLTVDFLQLV